MVAVGRQDVPQISLRTAGFRFRQHPEHCTDATEVIVLSSVEQVDMYHLRFLFIHRSFCDSYSVQIYQIITIWNSLYPYFSFHAHICQPLRVCVGRKNYLQSIVRTHRIAPPEMSWSATACTIGHQKVCVRIAGTETCTMQPVRTCHPNRLPSRYIPSSRPLFAPSFRPCRPLSAPPNQPPSDPCKCHVNQM